MKWFELAKLLMPVLAVALPGSAPLIPFIEDGITQAQLVHGDTNNAAKKQLVYDAAAAASATHKVAIDPATAVVITDAVFATIDNVHKIVQANPPTWPVPVVAPVVPPVVPPVA